METVYLGGGKRHKTSRGTLTPAFFVSAAHDGSITLLVVGVGASGLSDAPVRTTFLRLPNPTLAVQGVSHYHTTQPTQLNAHPSPDTVGRL